MDKILLFDFDGTIADSFENFLEIVTVLAKKHNLPDLSREELEKLRSEDARTLIKKLKIPFYKIPLLARDMKQLQKNNIAQLKPFDRLPEVLQELQKKGYVLGIVTSNAKENVHLFLKNNNISLFTYIYSDSSIFGKHTVLRKFLKEYNVVRENVTYIGDEIRDIEACRRVGIKIVAVTWGFTTKEGLVKHDPDFLIDAPSDLLKVVNI